MKSATAFEETARLIGEASALLRRGRFSDAAHRFEQALSYARDVGGREQAVVLNGLALAHAELGLTHRAEEDLERAAALAESAGDRALKGAVLNSMGELLRRQGRSREARERYQRALAAARASGVREGEGAVLNNLGLVCADLGAVEEAEGYFAAALQMRREIGDRAGEGQTLHNLGVLKRDTGELDDAERLLAEALEITEGLRDPFGVANILNAWGVLQSYRGQRGAALQAYATSLGIARDLGARGLEAACQGNVGQAFKELGRLDEARERLSAALAISRELEDRGGEARHLISLGGLERLYGRIREAEELIRSALVSSREAGDRRSTGLALRELGIIARDRGRPDEAVVHLAEALETARETGDPRAEADAHTSLGIVQGSLGRLEEAIVHHTEALSLRERVDAARASESLHNLGMVYRDLGRLDDALDRYRRALELERRLGDLRGEGGTRRAIAEVESFLGRPEHGEAEYRRALTRHREVRDRATEAATLAGLGDALLMQGRVSEAVEEYSTALGVAREVGDRNREVAVQAMLGVAHDREGLPAVALDYFEKAISALEALRAEVLSEDIKTSFFSKAYDVFTLYVHHLVSAGDVERALHVVERGKARTFIDLLSEARAEVREGIDPEVRENERRLTEERRAIRQQIVAIRSREPVDGDEAALAELTRREAELGLALEANEVEVRRFGRYADLTRPDVWDVERIRRELLDADTVLLEYMIAEHESYLFALTKDRCEVFTLPSREEIEGKVRELRAAVIYGLPCYPHGHELYRDLVEPAADLIRGKDLLICGDGALHYLPFALLLTEPPDEGDDGSRGKEPPGTPWRSAGAGEEEGALLERIKAQIASQRAFDFQRLSYLVRDHAISYAPSATVAGLLKRNRRGTAWERELVAFADPVIPASGWPALVGTAASHTGAVLGPLPKTRAEATSIAGLLAPRVSVFFGADATKDRALSLFNPGAEPPSPSTRFAHFSTHGLLDETRPQFSGLVLSPGATGDPFWQTFEIFNAHLAAELVVLSACETGLGRVVSGEGVVGLARAFFYAGAASVCVSLWKVAEDSTAVLMQEFYRRILDGESKAHALRQAQLALIEEGEYAHPFWWAPYVVVGDPATSKARD